MSFFYIFTHTNTGDYVKRQSVWEEYLKKNNFPELTEETNADIVIIGGGITGISTAYYLRKTGKKIILLEKNAIGSETTSRTTGKITFLQDGILTKIKNIYDEATSLEYYHSQKDAIKELISIIDDEHIDCDLCSADSYFFSNTKSKIKEIKSERDILKKAGEQVFEIDRLPDGLKVSYGIRCIGTYVFNPIKYINALAELIKNDLNIYENTKVTKIDKVNNQYIITANNIEIKASTIVVCTHYPYFLLPFMMPLKCSLEKSFIAAYQDHSDLNFSAISNDKPNISIRYVEGTKRFKLLLTNSQNLAFVNAIDKNFNPLKADNISYLWSNTDIITKDYLPYIGELSPSLYIATGYNTWGMTNSTLAGSIISNIIMNKNNQYADLFHPKRRSNIKTLLKYPLYISGNMYSYLYSKINKNKNWYQENVLITNINGVSVGIYFDESGRQFKVKNKCPHLGCSLIFNGEEKTWDCPCHASRFDLKGNCISGPSNYNISFQDENN